MSMAVCEALTRGCVQLRAIYLHLTAFIKIGGHAALNRGGLNLNHCAADCNLGKIKALPASAFLLSPDGRQHPTTPCPHGSVSAGYTEDEDGRWGEAHDSGADPARVRTVDTTPDARYNAALLHPTFGGYNSHVLSMDPKVCPTKFPQLVGSSPSHASIELPSLCYHPLFSCQGGNRALL